VGDPLQTLGIQVNAITPSAPSIESNTAAAWRNIAETSANLTAHISSLADKQAAFEGRLAGEAAGGAAGLPQIDSVTGLPIAGGAAAAGGRVAVSPEKIKSRKAYAKAFFMKQGWNDVQAAAIAGGLQQESNFNPGIVGDGGISMGIGQWNRERLTNLRRFAASRGTSWADFDTQLAFVHHELNTTESGAGSRLRAAGNIEQAAAAFIGYERPQGWTPQNPTAGHGFANRLAYAREAMGMDASKIAIQTPAPQGASPAAVAPAAAGMVAHPAATITMTAPPLRLTQSFTIRGQAYDEAAASIYADRLQSQALADLDGLAQQAGSDPAAAQALLKDYQSKFLSEVPAPLRPSMGAFLQRHSLGVVRDVTRQHEQVLEKEASGAFLQNYTARRTALVQLASRAGIDPKGNDAVAAELQSVSDFIGGSTNLDPAQKVKLQAELADDVTTARVLATFESRKDPQARGLFAQFLKQSYLSGEGLAAKMSPEAFARVDAQMQSVLAADQTSALKAQNATQRGIDSALTRLKGGLPLPETERTALKAQVSTLNDPELTASWQLYEGLANWQTVNRTQPPEVIDAQISAYEQKIAKDGATPADQTALETMQALSKTAHEALDKDPLAWAEQTGRIQPTPIDLSTPQALATSLTARAAEAHAVAQTYGRPPVFFKAAEKQALAKSFADNPDMIVGFAPALRQALGDRDTPRALAEISKDAPVVAHVAGLAMATGDDAFIRETAQALKLRAVPDHQAIKMPDGARAPLEAMTFLPNAEAAATQTAELVFDLRARQMGLDPKADPATATKLWDNIVNSALGAHEVNGETVGGMGDINGVPALLPPDMSADNFERMLLNLDEADVARMPPIASIEGYPVTADQLALGHPVAIGPGRYRMALGDPQGSDPQFVMNPDGGFWEFNVADLKRQASGGGGGGY